MAAPNVAKYVKEEFKGSCVKVIIMLSPNTLIVPFHFIYNELYESKNTVLINYYYYLIVLHKICNKSLKTFFPFTLK